jgi:hypothetical protein
MALRWRRLRPFQHVYRISVASSRHLTTGTARLGFFRVSLTIPDASKRPKQVLQYHRVSHRCRCTLCIFHQHVAQERCRDERGSWQPRPSAMPPAIGSRFEVRGTAVPTDIIFCFCALNKEMTAEKHFNIRVIDVGRVIRKKKRSAEKTQHCVLADGQCGG